MKSEWVRCKIGDVCEIRRGASPRPIHRYISNVGMPWVKIADATEDSSRYISVTKEYIINEGVKHSVIVEPETLIVSNSATPGLPKIMKLRACVHDGWLVFGKFNGILRDYLYYKFFEIRRNLTNQANGSVFQNLKTDIVKEYEITLPPLPTQKKIAAILSALDAKIENNNAINKNLEAQAQALFKSWFVDFDPFGGKMPEGWRVGKAEEFFDISIGKTPPRKETEWFTKDNQIKWASISDMGSAGVFIEETGECLTNDAIEKFKIKVVPKNTVLLSFKLTVGRVSITSCEMATNEAIAHFCTDNDDVLEYTYCYLKQFNFQTLGSTSSIAIAVNSKTVREMPFSLPAKRELKKFHLMVAPMFEKITQNIQQNTRLAALRDTLLPKLMSGEIEV